MNPQWQRTLIAIVAEIAGTFFLALAALAALTVGAPMVALVVGLTLLVFVYTIGAISGCHLNPAVTVALVTGRQFPWGQGMAYLVAQVIGAMLARLFVVNGWIGTYGSYHGASALAEFIGVGILVLAVAAVTENKVPRAGSGISIGAALAVGLAVTGGILNPAIAIAMNQGTTSALWAPLLGALAFAMLFAVLKQGTPPKPT